MSEEEPIEAEEQRHGEGGEPVEHGDDHQPGQHSIGEQHDEGNQAGHKVHFLFHRAKNPPGVVPHFYDWSQRRDNGDPVKTNCEAISIADGKV